MPFRQAIKWLWRNWARISDLAVDISWLDQDCGRWGRPKTVVTKRAQPPAGSHFGLRRSILTPRGPLTETVLLGTIAIRTGQKLNWDGPNMKVANVAAANEYVRSQYRQGWAL